MALVDSGSSKSIASPSILPRTCMVPSGSKCVMTVDGGSSPVVGSGTLQVKIGEKTEKIHCLVLEKLLPGCELLLGMDAIQQFGGVCIGSNRLVKFGVTNEVVCVAADEPSAAVTMIVEDKDFCANFSGGVWTVRWKWTQQPVLEGKSVGCYRIPEKIQEDFDSAIERWIAEGILEPVKDAESVVDVSIIPLMAVYQEAKKKTRPVLDFRELNKYISSHSGDAVVCDETLRRWRQKGENLEMVDLKDAYLQLKVDKDLWKFQVVNYKGRLYYLTRLGFGLNCAPQIMSKILDDVLGVDKEIAAGTDHYIDDIVIDRRVASTEKVVAHLNKFGLRVKDPEDLTSAKVLGLQLYEKDGGIRWCRGNTLPEQDWSKSMTRRQLFSLTGQLVGHYPRAGWLRVACSFIKRHSSGRNWEDDIGQEALHMIEEVVKRVESDDPVGGKWSVEPQRGVRLWCDASSIALGCVVEVGGELIEDAAWLRKKDDGTHINVSELEAVLRGVNLAVKWGFKKFTIMTDSATVKGWITSILSRDRRIKTHGIAEMIVRRRLSIIRELVSEYALDVAVELVPSEKNKADVLTRVSKRWLEVTKSTSKELCLYVSNAGTDDASNVLRTIHERHHFGVNRTMFAARRLGFETSREQARKVVDSCEACCTIDPAPVKWKKGHLSVKENWHRLAVDVTHYRGMRFFTLVDCGPSRFAIWRRISAETAAAISTVLRQIFRERGPPMEILSDNGAAFRSRELSHLCKDWDVRQIFRAAHRPSGNGIVERHHRTVKAAATRGRLEPEDVVFWYNALPTKGIDAETIPAERTYTYKWRIPGFGGPPLQDEQSDPFPPYIVGDEVVVKPIDGRCTSAWTPGVVTKINGWNVEVDGVPRHVADIRLRRRAEEQSVKSTVEWDLEWIDREFDHACPDGAESDSEMEGSDRTSVSASDGESESVRQEPSSQRRHVRSRRRPAWLTDFEMDSDSIDSDSD